MSRTSTRPHAQAVLMSKAQGVVQQPTPSPEDEKNYEESDASTESDAIIDRDETEEELERLVFGDSAGFRDALRDFTLDEETEVRDKLPETSGLEGLDDADLFFTDLASGNGPTPIPGAVQDEESEDETIHSQLPPAWEDSDDERTLVSLANVPRLRKLRRTEAEDVVNGKEYAKRLRHQFQLLNPVPDWARTATSQPARKRRRLSGDSDSFDDADEMDLDAGLPSVTPLSKLLQTAEPLVRQSVHGAGRKRKIRPEVIDIQRQKDVPDVQPSAITSLSFHSTLPLLLSCGPASTLYLHHITPSPPAPTANPLLTSVHLRGSRLATAAFHPTDSRIFLAGQRPYFHVWDLDSGRVEKITQMYGLRNEQRNMQRFKLSPDGKYVAIASATSKNGGNLNLIDAATMQWVSQVRIESRHGIAEFAWWRDSKGLTIAGRNGEITEWDVNERRIIARWQDEGAIGTTVIALGGQHELVKSPIGTDRWIAIGSSSGIVNIYDRRAWHHSSRSTTPLEIPTNPKPTRMLEHLTTPTSTLAFSHDGQILAMASKWKRDVLRLVHLPSCTVFKNWPTSNTPLGRITGITFAAGDVVNGGKGDTYCVMAVANDQGKIKLWDIR